MIRPAFRAAITAAVVAVLGSAASAKAPTGVASLEEIEQKARLAEAELQRKALEAQRDPNKEAIENYRTKKSPLTEWQKVVQIVLDQKTPEIQDYRLGAGEAIVARFAQEDAERDPRVRQVRLEIATELVELLRREASDDRGLLIAETVFYAWYRGPLINSHWKKEGKLRDRQAAYAEMKKFLKKSAKD